SAEPGIARPSERWQGTLVAGEDHQRLLFDAECAQSFEQSPDLSIHLDEHAAKIRPRIVFRSIRTRHPRRVRIIEPEIHKARPFMPAQKIDGLVDEKRGAIP